MKKYLLLSIFASFSIFAFCQYKPTKNDIGRDCTTEDHKLGTWTEVTRTETTGGSRTSGSSSSSSQNFNASAGASVGTKATNVSGNVSYGNGSSNSSSYSNTNSTSSSRSYKQIECVEDRNANLPQQTPVRW